MHRLALPLLLAAALVLSGCAEGLPPADTPSATAVSPSPSATDEGGIARSAAVTASSENTADGMVAANAIDGDPATEWATVGGGVGSTLLLEWKESQRLGSITLLDRPNADDQITAGALRFSDGSEVLVPELPDGGEPMRIEFSPRSVTSVLFTVDEVSPSTTDIGLSEIEADAPASVASVLGSERVIADADSVLRVVPGAVASVDVSGGVRLVRVELEIDALLGATQPDQSWFALLGADGSRYEPVDDPADDLADPIIGLPLEAGEVLTATVHFEIPADASGLLIAYAPDGEVVATWSLNAA